MTITAISVAQSLDWKGWLLGLWGAFISGGAAAVGGGFGTMVIDPEHFNILQGGLRHLGLVMAVCFAFSGAISLMKFLQLHPVPSAEAPKGT
jgi:hypothetical protein